MWLLAKYYRWGRDFSHNNRENLDKNEPCSRNLRINQPRLAVAAGCNREISLSIARCEERTCAIWWGRHVCLICAKMEEVRRQFIALSVRVLQTRAPITRFPPPQISTSKRAFDSLYFPGSVSPVRSFHKLRNGTVEVGWKFNSIRCTQVQYTNLTFTKNNWIINTRLLLSTLQYIDYLIRIRKFRSTFQACHLLLF